MVNYLDAIRELQGVSRKFPMTKPACDRAITALIVLSDKLRKYEPKP